MSRDIDLSQLRSALRWAHLTGFVQHNSKASGSPKLKQSIAKIGEKGTKLEAYKVAAAKVGLKVVSSPERHKAGAAKIGTKE